MTILTTHEQQEIDRANTEGKQPVVFVHGLWLLSSSWDRWRALFEEQGYTTLAPGWPDDPQTVEEANDDPEVFAHKRLKQITDHYIDAIRQLKRKPCHRPFLRWAHRANGGRGGRGRCDGRHRSRSVPRRASPAALGDQVVIGGAGQSPQLHPGRPADLRAVPLCLRQRCRRERSPRVVRKV